MPEKTRIHKNKSGHKEKKPHKKYARVRSRPTCLVTWNIVLVDLTVAAVCTAFFIQWTLDEWRDYLGGGAF